MTAEANHSRICCYWVPTAERTFDVAQIYTGTATALKAQGFPVTSQESSESFEIMQILYLDNNKIERNSEEKI